MDVLRGLCYPLASSKHEAVKAVKPTADRCSTSYQLVACARLSAAGAVGLADAGLGLSPDMTPDERRRDRRSVWTARHAVAPPEHRLLFREHLRYCTTLGECRRRSRRGQVPREGGILSLPHPPTARLPSTSITTARVLQGTLVELTGLFFPRASDASAELQGTRTAKVRGRSEGLLKHAAAGSIAKSRCCLLVGLAGATRGGKH